MVQIPTELYGEVQSPTELYAVVQSPSRNGRTELYGVRTWYRVVRSCTYVVVHSRTELYGVVQSSTELYVQSPTE